MNLTTIYALIIILIILKINRNYGHRHKLKYFVNDEYYIEPEQKYTWMDALIACVEMNMTLVTIDSRTKSDEINDIVKTNFGVIKLWIGGLMTRFPSEHFIWIATGKPFSYTNWYGNNPNFYAKLEYCAHIGWGKNLEWNDIACIYQQGFICEKNQQQERTVQLQTKLDDKLKKNQELQLQLQQNNKKQQILEKQMENNQKQKDSLQQELEKVKKTAEKETQKYQEEIVKQQNKLKQDLEKLENLEYDLQSALEKQHTLQHDLQEQQNLRQLVQEELNTLKEKQQTASTDVNKKKQDIILHFHQNQ